MCDKVTAKNVADRCKMANIAQALAGWYRVSPKVVSDILEAIVPHFFNNNPIPANTDLFDYFYQRLGNFTQYFEELNQLR